MNLSEVARREAVPYQRLWSMVKAGIALDVAIVAAREGRTAHQVLNPKVPKAPKPKRFNISAAAREHGFAPDAVRRRIVAGATPEEAVAAVLTQPKKGFRGPIKDSVAVRARAAGVDPKSVQQRMRDGMSFDEAVAASK